MADLFVDDPYAIQGIRGGPSSNEPVNYQSAEISPEEARAFADLLVAQTAPPPPPKPGAISAGLSAGWNQMQSSGAGLIGDLATITNLPSLKQWADAEQDFQAAEAEKYGRPDLENWRQQKLDTALPFLGYQIAKQVPLIGSVLGASALTGGAAAGVGLAGALGVGEMYGQAREAGIENKPGVALGALGLGVPYGFLETVTPYALEKGLIEGFTGNIGKRAIKGLASGFAKEAITEAAQTGLEMSFRPDLPIADKAQNVIDAAVTGGLVGGSLGGITGAISKKPEQVTDPDLRDNVDAALGLPAPEKQLGLPAPDSQSIGGLPAPEAQAALPPPALGLPAPEPVPPGPAPRSVFADVPPDQLNDSITAQQQLTLENNNPATRQLLREAQGELERSQARSVIAAAEQSPPVTPEEIANVEQAKNFLDQYDFQAEAPSLFTKEDFDQTPRASAARVPVEIGSGPTINLPAAEDLRSEEQNRNEAIAKTKDAITEDFARDGQGKLSEKDLTFIKTLDAGSRGEVANDILNKLNETGEISKTETRLAQSYGLLKQDGTVATLEDLNKSAAKLRLQVSQQTIGKARKQELSSRLNMLQEVVKLQTEQAAAQAQNEQLQSTYDNQFIGLQKGDQASLALPDSKPVLTASGQAQLNFDSQPTTTAASTQPAPVNVTSESTDQTRLSLTRNVSDELIEDYKAAVSNESLGPKVRRAAADLLPILQNARAANKTIPYENFDKMDVVERAIGKAPVFEQAQAAGIQIPARDTMIKTIRARYPRFVPGKRSIDEIIQKYIAVKQPKGVKNAVQKSEPTSVLSPEPSKASGPVGKRDAQGTTASIESLSEGNLNEESSSKSDTKQSIAQEKRANKESRKESAGRKTSVEPESPAKVNQTQQEIKRELKADIAKAKRVYREQQKTSRTTERTPTPAVSKVTGPEMERSIPRAASSQISSSIIKNDKTIPKAVRASVDKALQALGEGDSAPLNFLYRSYDRVTKAPEAFKKSLNKAFESAVQQNDPKIFDDAFDDMTEEVNRQAPDESVLLGKSLRSPTAEQKTGRMTVEAVKAILKSKLSQWAGLPEVRVVSENDPNLSAADRAFLKQSQVFKGLGAFTWQNDKPVLLLNADKLTPSEVLPTLYHEALGHFGLRSAYGQQLRALLEDLYVTTPSIQDAVDAYIKARPQLEAEINSYDTMDAEEARIQLVEEVLAEQSEKGVLKQSIFSQLKALVEKFARWAGLRTGAFSQDEIMSIIRTGQQTALNPSKLTQYYLRQSYLDDRLNQSPLRFANVNQNLKDATEQAKQQYERFINSTNTQEKFGARLGDWRNNILPAMSVHHMAERYGKILPGLKKYYDTLKIRGANINHLAHVWSSVHSSFEMVRKQNRAAAQLINDVMQFTALKIDPSKSFNQQTKEFRDIKDPAQLQIAKQRVAEANKLYTDLENNPKALQVYQNYRTLNDMMIHSMDAENLFELLSGSTLIPDRLQKLAAKLDPMEGFRLQTGMESDTTKALNNANNYFKSRADELLKLADAYIAGAYGKPDDKIIDPIKRLKDAITERRAVIKDYPYFHLGRQGDMTVSFHIRNSAITGKAASSVADRQAIQDALDKAGFKFELALASDATKVFLRVDSAAEQDAVLEVLNKLQAQKLLDPKKEIKTGVKLEDTLRVGAQPWLEALRQDAQNRYDRQVEEIKNASLTPSKKQDALVAAARNLEAIKTYIIDSSPNTSAALVSLHRKNVPGYMSDMVRAGAYRAQVWTLALANMSSRRAMNDAMVQMRAAAKAENSKVQRSDDNSRGRLLESIVNELATREAIRPFLTGRTWHDTVAAWNHSYFLGLSPSYVMLQFTQLGVMLWPRLVQDFKNVSFLDAARTIGRNTPAAIQLVKAMIAEGKSQGAWNWADAPVTLAALNKTSLTKNQKEFIMRFVNLGNLDVGSAAREQGRIVEGERKDFRDTTLRIASSFGYYSEVATRMIAALSAYDLYMKSNKGVTSADAAAYNKMLDSVSATVDGSMFNYNTTNTARFLGKMGFAGPLTRVMMTFYKYTASLLEALSRSIMDGFLGGANVYPEAERADRIQGARRFMAAHLTAMMMVSGSLGLPFTSAIAAVINGIFGDDDEPYDAVVAWRNFLASVFGEDLGEVLARGGGRALGVEFSQRTSEADILPFTKMFADRRTWLEASKDWAANMFGSPLSMTANILDGATDFMDGDFVRGAERFAPNFLKGPVKAAKMYTEGAYLDKKNNAYPNISPGAGDILMQAFGFMPSELANVKERERAYAVRQGIISREAAQIRSNLAVAVEKQDVESFNEWRQRAIEFNRANPRIDILKTLPAVLKRRAQERAGVTKSDLEQKQLYKF